MKAICYKYQSNGKYYRAGQEIELSDTQKLLFTIYGGKDTNITYESHPYYEKVKTVILNNTKKDFSKVYNLQMEFDKIELYIENSADELCDMKIIS